MTADAIALVDALERPNVRPFLWMIRHGEGTQGEHGYRTMFGGGLFDSYADHPRKVITRKLGGKPISSSAAGAYQFLRRTWDALVEQYGFADFSPVNQDLGCVALIAGRKALDDVIAGRFESAVKKCAKEWASLPGSPYGQPVVTIAEAKAQYEAAGGAFIG
jgi:muramidase (phage lysozyme)